MSNREYQEIQEFCSLTAQEFWEKVVNLMVNEDENEVDVEASYGDGFVAMFKITLVSVNGEGAELDG